ncbi:MAG: DUF805 domain-containing protein [Caulobacteraceae bacterium]|nr:DUF805 domain-containing protein [Caulobacter sp.]
MSALNQLFLNGAGRIGRGPFWAGAVVLMALLALYEAATPPAAQRWTGWLADLLLLFAACAVLSKRLHDRGRSGWWAALVILAFDNVWPSPRGLGWLFAPVLLAAAVDLGLLPGQSRFNRYGPRPQAAARLRATQKAPA